jgi:hypothetical protein
MGCGEGISRNVVAADTFSPVYAKPKRDLNPRQKALEMRRKPESLSFVVH